MGAKAWHQCLLATASLNLTASLGSLIAKNASVLVSEQSGAIDILLGYLQDVWSRRSWLQ